MAPNSCNSLILCCNARVVIMKLINLILMFESNMAMIHSIRLLCPREMMIKKRAGKVCKRLAEVESRGRRAGVYKREPRQTIHQNRRDRVDHLVAWSIVAPTDAADVYDGAHA